MFKKIKEDVVYKGWNTIVNKTYDNGMVREIKRSNDAAAIALYNSIGMVLVRQYRAAPEKITLEIPAGIMDVDGEDPIGTVVRETQEETGLMR
jgi:ADP-ribose pyrophosphatase